MSNKLVENKFGTGAPITSLVRVKTRRKLRPKFHKSPYGAGAGFDWNQGYDVGDFNIKNQYQSSSCGGQAASRLREIIIFLLTGRKEELSAKSVYSQGCASGGGMTIASVEHQISDIGINTENDVPSYLVDGTTNEIFMTDKSWVTSTLLSKALRNATLIPHTVNIDIDSIAQAMQSGGAVLFLVQGQNNGTWFSPKPAPPVNRKNLWAHYITSKFAKIINDIKMIGFFQSWGKNVGNDGIQFFNEEYIKSGYIVDCVVFLPKSAAITQVQPDGTVITVGWTQWLLIFYQHMLQYYRRFLGK